MTDTHPICHSEFYEKLSLFEIKTQIKYANSIDYKNNGFVRGVYYKDAYAKNLEKVQPFIKINWNENPFLDFRILKTNPPKHLIVSDEGTLKFTDYISYDNDKNNWETFIDSFRQVRNNLVHGAKLFKSGNLHLEDRDLELISAALKFIDYLVEKGLIEELH